MTSVARLRGLDPTLTELVRLRGARQHDCRLCASRRSQEAISQGAGDAEFDAVDHYASSDLPDPTKAALALVDAMIWTPNAIPEQVVADVRRHLSDAQAVEVVLDVARNAANKIAVALRADAPEVTEGVQLFTTDMDGTLTVVA
jgi:alkylhydroperoxidase family enzyme